jgi:hypothetical protein
VLTMVRAERLVPPARQLPSWAIRLVPPPIARPVY